MICKKCGEKIKNGTEICPECGESLHPNVPKANAKSMILKEETDHVIIWYIKKKAVYMTVAVLVIIVVGFNLLMAAVSFFNRIDFTKYVLVEVNGYDGRGLINVQIDSDGLSSKLFGKASDELEGEERQRLVTVTNLLQSGIETEGITSGCSNGDELVLQITNLDALSEAVNQKCKRSDKIIYTVKDLRETSVLSFEDLFDVSFDGFNGAGYVVVTPKEANVPWDTTFYHNEVYIDGHTYNIYCQEGAVGALSNEDRISIGLAPKREDISDDLLDAYGLCVSDEATSYTVSGLSDSQSVDVMSMVEVTFNGVDGSAEVSYLWSQEEYQQGNVRIVPRDEQSDSFNIKVNSVPDSDSGIIILPEGEVISTTDKDLGWFYLNADKNGSISAGDTVRVSIRSDRFDSLDNGVLASCGVEFAELEKSLSVDSAMIPRLVTSLDQVNSQNLHSLVLSLINPVNEQMEADWSSIVHENRNYVCYDHTVVEGPYVLEARLVCTDTDSNSYSLWIVYLTEVTDSELDEVQDIYTVVHLDRPVVYQDESKTVDYSGDMQMNFGRDPEFIYNAWWYSSENSVAIYF